MSLNDIEIFNRILKDELITPVYQPIVSLLNGQIYGYEALSRVLNNKTSSKIVDLSIEQIFRMSDGVNKSLEFEALCRSKALKNAKSIIETGKKLFLNVNPNIINSANFKAGLTKGLLDKEGIDSRKVVFEITESIAITNRKIFLSSINHYRNQNYMIAIDNVGSGYSGLNMINDIKPDIIKLDMNLIRNIDKDETKQFLCKSIVDFCKDAGIKVLAEGIETEDELRMLIKLNIELGQGYFIGVPCESLTEIAAEKINLIKKYYEKKIIEISHSSVYPIVGYLSKKGCCFSPNENTVKVYEILKHNHNITEFVIIDNENAVGFMTKTDMNELFGGEYGYSLHSKGKISELANKDFLKVNYNTPIDLVSRLAMQRPFEQLYNPLVVEQEEKYAGIVTIKDLLDTCTKTEVARERAEKERIVAELNVAKQIQSSMLPCIFPPFPHRSEFDIYASMLPAKEVGGDFYDFFLIDENQLAVVIADVSGKGVPAALFMVIAKTLIKSNAQYGKSPRDVFETVNNLLCENNEAGMFVTAFMGILDIPSGIFNYVNAGHDPPLLKHADGNIKLLSVNSGFVLAGLEDMFYEQDKIQLVAGDMLFLYTDGVTEAFDKGKNLFGRSNLLEAFNLYKDCELKEMLASIKSEIDKFADGAEQADDITMLVLKMEVV
jgi:serine phosphatase RsbU (regulator of sigma subunit)/EAL domain-containing protein (putative c-di-GMP-specific phosphodiesterase class I)/predicted transcriptional regulator